jgi:chemotaxis signal transduction protein
MSLISNVAGQGRETLLAERARRLAERPRQGGDVARVRVCICEVGTDLIGLPVGAMARVMPHTNAAPLANADAALLGIVSQGAGFALVYDLAALMSGDLPQAGSEGHLVLLRNRRPLTGLKVSRTVEITEIERLTAEEALNLPARASVTAYGRAGDNRIVSIIDIEALLNAKTQSGGST